jgi:hypothetical protein
MNMERLKIHNKMCYINKIHNKMERLFIYGNHGNCYLSASILSVLQKNAFLVFYTKNITT